MSMDALGRWFLNIRGYTSYRRMRLFVFTKCLTSCFLCPGAPFGSPVQTFDPTSNPCFLEVSYKKNLVVDPNPVGSTSLLADPDPHGTVSKLTKFKVKI